MYKSLSELVDLEQSVVSPVEAANSLGRESLSGVVELVQALMMPLTRSSSVRLCEFLIAGVSGWTASTRGLIPARISLRSSPGSS